MAEFFDDDEDPDWVVRGIDAIELEMMKEDVRSNPKISKEISAGSKGVPDEAVEAIKVIFSVASKVANRKVPDTYVMNLSLVAMGSIAPEVSKQQAAQLAKRHPVQFAEIASKVLELTGLGSETAGKSKNSGRAPG